MGRSEYDEYFWIRRKNPAGKVFRRWSPAASGGGRPAGLPPGSGGGGVEKRVRESDIDERVVVGAVGGGVGCGGFGGGGTWSGGEKGE
nr:hypothetical protein [Tanacetum cinerariifolium]